MQRTASRIETELRPIGQPAPSHRALAQEYDLRCGVCGKVAFVDEETASRVNEAIAAGVDNPFLCEICEVYDDLWYEK